MDYPYLKSWWINHGQILAGRCPCDLKSDVESQMLQSLVELGITHFINLQEEDERVGGKLFKDYMPEARSYALGKGRELGFHRFPITDKTVSRVSNMIACLNHIDEVLAEAGKPYVHCWGGNGRTGTVIGCWLVRQGRSAEEAFTEMATGRVGRGFSAMAPENDKQRAFVKEWSSLDPALSTR